jgi:hypothetical protein
MTFEFLNVSIRGIYDFTLEKKSKDLFFLKRHEDEKVRAPVRPGLVMFIYWYSN